MRAQSREGLGCQSFVLIIGDLNNQSNDKDSVIAEKFGAHFVYYQLLLQLLKIAFCNFIGSVLIIIYPTETRCSSYCGVLIVTEFKSRWMLHLIYAPGCSSSTTKCR